MPTAAPLEFARRRLSAMKRWLIGLLAFVALLLSGPLFMFTSDEVRLGQHWYNADRSPTGLAPDPTSTPEAIVQIYAARTFSWRGLFAVHTWVATKPAGADAYTVDQVTAWRHPALESRHRVPDRHWVGATPQLLLDLRGPVAERAIAHIQKALPEYPFPDYRIWPGPNSNTFTAWLVRHVPELHVQLPSTAIGKDYLAGTVAAAAPSGRGYQLSLYGTLGVLAAWEEGVEFNVFGLVWGIDATTGSIKWPGIGRIGFGTPWPRRDRPR